MSKPRPKKMTNPDAGAGMRRAVVVGAGLAGCEAAWQLARRGISVTLYDMKPARRSPAHHTDGYAELVCSNSLKSDALTNAAGLLKEELRRLGSLLIACADAVRVPAGGALAVDRDAFSALVTERVRAHPLITAQTKEVSAVPEPFAVVATGPLTDGALAADMERRFGKALSFFDAACPIVTADSIDMDKAFFAARYDKGTPDYINCPMDEDEYTAFWQALTTAECTEQKAFEREAFRVFEGCMPVEVMAKRGADTLRFGPLKPVGLRDPRTGRTPYAVVQLRRDNSAGTLYNMVGFQTNLRFGEQKRVFSMIPALKNAEFVRYGVMHRNSFLHSPGILSDNYEVLDTPGLFFAGQITGVEGYVESIASGLCAGMALAARIAGNPPPRFPGTTVTGALARYISDLSVRDFQPMNSNFGIVDGLSERVRGKRERYGRIAERALADIDALRARQRQIWGCALAAD